MRPIIIIDEQVKFINNPFVLKVVKHTDEFNENEIYIIRRIDKYPNLEFDYFNKQISENLYWSESETEIDDLIYEILEKEIGYKKINIITKDIHFDKVFLYKEENRNLILDLKGEVYYFNETILENFKLNVSFKEIITFQDLIPKMIHLGMIGEKVSKENLKKYFSYYESYYFLFLIRLIDSIELEDTTDLDVYKNIIEVEQYLNLQEYDNELISFKKLEEYNLDYVDDVLTFYNYGLFNRTGRIFQTSDNGFNLQTLPNKFKDIIRLKDKTKLLVEIDFSAFEYNLLCQILDIPISEDPHIEIFNKVVKNYHLEYEEKRALGKQINYGIIFGSSLESITKLIITELGDLEAEMVHRNLSSIEILSEREELKNELKNELNEFGHISNFFGRKLLVEKENAELNYFVQSTACDFFYIKFLKILKLFETYKSGQNRILLQKFDSVLMELNVKDCIDGNLLTNMVEILSEKEYGLFSKFKIVKGYNWKNMS